MNTLDHRPQVVIVGAGFGGVRAVQVLANSQLDVLVLDRNNYHTFLPLLYQVAAAELEPEAIIYPVRSVLRKKPNVRFLMNEVTEVDLCDRWWRSNGGGIHRCTGRINSWPIGKRFSDA
jgi:NADH dehydrogenase